MTQQTRIQYEVQANQRVTYSLHQNTDIYWHSVPMSVEGEQTSQFQNESSWSNMPLFHLFETQFHSTYIFLYPSPVNPYLNQFWFWGIHFVLFFITKLDFIVKILPNLNLTSGSDCVQVLWFFSYFQNWCDLLKFINTSVCLLQSISIDYRVYMLVHLFLN